MKRLLLVSCIMMLLTGCNAAALIALGSAVAQAYSQSNTNQQPTVQQIIITPYVPTFQRNNTTCHTFGKTTTCRNY